MPKGIRSALRAYPTMLRIGLADAMAYRTEMVIWMLTTTMPLVSLALWSAVAAEAPVGGFTPGRFSAYFVATLLVRQVTGSWLVWELNMEIRSGGLSRRLLRPLPPLVAYSAENLAALPLRAALALPITVAALALSAPNAFSYAPWVLGLFAVSLVGAWLINFFVMALIGSLAFFLESSTAIFELWLVAFMVLSGYLVPLDLFPPALRTLSTWLPFRYTVAFPVELLLGMLPLDRALREIAVQWAYVGISATCALLAFRAGLRRFAAFGG